jgi:hypothetical protein
VTITLWIVVLKSLQQFKEIKVGKTFKDRLPHERIRIPVPKPGRAIPSERDYNRKKGKAIVLEEEEDD